MSEVAEGASADGLAASNYVALAILILLILMVVLVAKNVTKFTLFLMNRGQIKKF